MDLTKYKEMEDSLEPEQTRRLFQELLALPKPKDCQEATDIAEALWELADRHWHTYTHLDKETKKDLDVWIAANWDRCSEKMTGWLIGVIGNIGLERSLRFMEAALDSELPDLVREKITRALSSFGSTINDPYAGMGDKKVIRDC